VRSKTLLIAAGALDRPTRRDENLSSLGFDVVE